MLNDFAIEKTIAVVSLANRLVRIALLSGERSRRAIYESSSPSKWFAYLVCSCGPSYRCSPGRSLSVEDRLPTEEAHSMDAFMACACAKPSFTGSVWYCGSKRRVSLPHRLLEFHDASRDYCAHGTRPCALSANGLRINSSEILSEQKPCTHRRGVVDASKSSEKSSKRVAHDRLTQNNVVKMFKQQWP